MVTDGQDFIATDFNFGRVEVLLGNGDGTFTQAPDVAQPGNSGAGGVVVGDFNGDGIEDLAIPEWHLGVVGIRLGLGNGQFSSAPDVPDLGDLVVGDVNHDGHQDLVVVGGGSVDTWFGTGAGTFTPGPSLPIEGGVTGVAAGDFNGDGNMDLALANHFSSRDVSILLGNGQGGFTPAPSVAVPGGDAFALTVADFNGDATQDLAVTIRPRGRYRSSWEMAALASAPAQPCRWVPSRIRSRRPTSTATDARISSSATI